MDRSEAEGDTVWSAILGSQGVLEIIVERVKDMRVNAAHDYTKALT
jgi:hypothetical protein